MVREEIDRLNSNFDIFANGGENSDGKALRIDTAVMKGKNLLYECWGPSFFHYGSNTSGAPSAWPGLVLAFILPYGSEAVSYTHLDVYKRQLPCWIRLLKQYRTEQG